IIIARIPAGQTPDEASRVHILADWLISEEPPEPQPDEQPEQLAQSVSLVTNIADILAGTAQSAPKTPVASGMPGAELQIDTGWQPDIVPGQKSSYEIFEGRTGRRQAALNMLYQIIQSDQPLDFFMTSEDDMRWLTEDASYTALWTRLLRQAVEKGHQVTIIHIVSRRINEIMGMLAYWIPLHMAGQMNSYYYPRFGDRRIRQTYMIVRGHAALFSSTLADFTGNDLTYRFDDPLTVEQNMRLFNVHLSQCRPLFTLFGRDNTRSYFEYVSEQSKKPAAVSSIRHLLNIRCLPVDLLSRYVHDAPGDLPVSKLISLLAAQQQDFYNRLDQESTIDILPLSLFESIQSEGITTLPCCEIFSDKPTWLSDVDTLAWLRQTYDTLKRFPNYELYLAPDSSVINSLRINITFKENITAFFSPTGPFLQPAATVALNESNVLHSLSYYFDDVIQQIPASLRNRQDVMTRLERLIATLSGLPTAK
ncbi:MAG TPA: hypothetical protein DCM45_04470, partial [Clostridiales bacterium]|nr:hypothetical protein [Clostridiales bacterium]